jgi:hypothetical protein
MFQGLALHQGASQLQTASADRLTFLANIPFQLIHLPLLNLTKLPHYRIVLLSSISLTTGTDLNLIIIIIIIIIIKSEFNYP